ncbi:hypothetical protein [Candidatus Ichthyocystis hellenicum]|uniref:hypothetical protein n=1 Tax=Candidatus Ichthyocystis hellenicum TaxID=1561003 RepID=UPI000B868B1C|nr:hypothetical protein [Candidatus Ichthyocystis hellenicum]
MYNQGDGLVEHHHTTGGDCITTRDEGSVEDSSGQSTSGATKTAGSGSGATSTSSAAAPASSAPAAAAAASAAAAAAAATTSPPPTTTALTVVMKKAFGDDWSTRFGSGFANGLLGTPGDPNRDDDILGNFNDLEDFFLSQNSDSFIALLAVVMMMLVKSSSQEAARERTVKMEELLDSLKENLDASAALSEGATQAFISGMVSGIVGLVGAGAGMGGGFYSSRLKGQSADMATELEGLSAPEAAELMRVDMPDSEGNGTQVMSAEEMLKIRKSDLVTKMTALDNKAATVTNVSEGVGRMSGSAASMGSAASTMQLTKAQAIQAHNQALGSEQAQTFGIEDDWQKGLTQLKDMILSVVSDAVRSMAQANSSAFRS